MVAGRHLPFLLRLIVWCQGKEKKKLVLNNDNALGWECAGIIAEHYVCSIYTSSHGPTTADG